MSFLLDTDTCSTHLKRPAGLMHRFRERLVRSHWEEATPMSFRRDGKKANAWRKRLEPYSDLLQQAGLPDVVLQDEFSWWRFLWEGCFQGDNYTPLIDAMKYLSESQKYALYKLLSKYLAEKERVGSELWLKLVTRFGQE